MQRNEVDRNKVAPMMRHYLELKDNYEDTLLFYRLGDFYEMFFEDAITASHELELTLTGKSCGLEERVPMCGIPHHAANIYIDKLIEKGYKVGICEQLEDPALAKGIVERDLIQIVSPGTIISQESLVDWDNNYIGNIIDLDYAYGVSYTDISTGEIKAFITDKNNNKVVSQILSIGIKEIVADSKVATEIIGLLKNQYKIVVTITDQINDYDYYDYIFKDLKDMRYKRIVNHLLTYITNTQKRFLNHFQTLKTIELDEHMKMDVHTKRNLELTETLRLKQRNYSLIWLLDKTKTAPGARLLKTFIENPEIKMEVINKRLDIVSTLMKEFILKNDVL